MGVPTASVSIQPISAGRHGFPDEYVRYLQRARIFDATTRLVAEVGVVDAPFDRLHQPMGVTKARLYELYPSREHLVVEAMDHALSFAAQRICAAFDRAPTPPDGLDAAIWALLDAAEAAPTWTRFALVEAVAAGPEAWRRRDAALAPVRERLKRLMPADRPRDAPQWGVEAVIAALRPELVAGPLRATPRLHRDLVHLVSVMCGMPAPDRAAKRPAAVPRTRATMADRVTRAFFAVDGEDGLDELRDAVGAAAAKRHGPALSQAIRCLVARNDEQDFRFDGLRQPIVDALPDAWVFGTPLRHPGPRPYSLNASRLRVLEVIREVPEADQELVRAATRQAPGTCGRILRDLTGLELLHERRRPRERSTWTLTDHGLALLHGEHPQYA